MDNDLNQEELAEESSPMARSAEPGVTQDSDLTLLDGGASHDVCIGSTLPEGSVETDVKLALPSRKGYVKDGCITSVDKDKELTGQTPKLIYLGRFIQKCDLKFAWTRTGATLELPRVTPTS